MSRILEDHFENKLKVRRLKVASKQKEAQESISLLINKTYYKFLHIFGCMNFGFFEYKSSKQRKFWKLITTTQFIVFCVFNVYIKEYLYYESFYVTISSCTITFYYIGNVCSLSLMHSNKSLYSALLDLKKIDSIIKIDLSHKSNMLLNTANILCTGFRSFIFVISCIMLKLFLPPVYIFTFVMMLQHAVLVSYSSLFVLINWRLKKLSSVLKDNSDYFALQGVYKAIVDLAESQANAFSPMLLIALLYNIPQVMYNIFFLVFPEKFDLLTVMNISQAVLYLNYAEVLQCLLLVLAPALCAGTIASQAAQMKIILYDKLMQSQDEMKAREIERFIQYVQERDCRFRVYQLIPLDASLIGMVLNFCVTYLIVIIQFSK